MLRDEQQVGDEALAQRPDVVVGRRAAGDGLLVGRVDDRDGAPPRSGGDGVGDGGVDGGFEIRDRRRRGGAHGEALDVGDGRGAEAVGDGADAAAEAARERRRVRRCRRVRHERHADAAAADVREGVDEGRVVVGPALEREPEVVERGARARRDVEGAAGRRSVRRDGDGRGGLARRRRCREREDVVRVRREDARAELEVDVAGVDDGAPAREQGRVVDVRGPLDCRRGAARADERLEREGVRGRDPRRHHGRELDARGVGGRVGVVRGDAGRAENDERPDEHV